MKTGILLFIIFSSFLGYSQGSDSTYQEVEEVFISSKKKKDIVFEDPKYFIVDFSVTYDKSFLFMKSLGKYL